MTGTSRPLHSSVSGLRRDWLALGLAAFAVYNLALGLFMVAAPGAFYELIGPFGERNDHYTRDNATFGLALGAAALLAVRLRRWRLPVLVILAVQFSLHAVNHLVDIGAARPEVVGPIDFALIALGAALATFLAVRARREQQAQKRPGATGAAGAKSSGNYRGRDDEVVGMTRRGSKPRSRS